MLALLVISCDLATLMPVQSMPSPIPGVVNTIVAETAAAAATQTAANITVVPTWTPSLTPEPTRTPSLTPSLTPTFIFRLATRTPTRRPTSTAGSTSGLACQLVSQSPDDGARFDAKENFTATWKVKNTGDATWDSNSVDFAFLSGTKMYRAAAVYDLPSSVAVGDPITLSVPMAAPKNSGSYRTVWTLRQGNDDFCHVDLRIVVR